MRPDEMVVGTRVRSLRPFAGVPIHTEGVIDSATATSSLSISDPEEDFWMVAWDLPESPLPAGYERWDGKWAIESGVLRDGFNQYELQWLEKVGEVGKTNAKTASEFAPGVEHTADFRDVVFLCPDCGTQERMEFDANRLRNRIFEGVMFDVLVEKERIVVRPKQDDMGYLADFNLPKLMGEAIEEISRGELSAVYCPKCKEPLE